jgi:nitronate monooxygenase
MLSVVSRTGFFSLADLEHPIVQAPMGGGASTPALAAAVAEAGGLGFLAAGYKSPAAVREDIEALKSLTGRPFGVNLFAPPGSPADAAAIAAFAASLEPEADRYGTPVGAPKHDDDGWEAKLALVASLEVPVVSFTFGCPEPQVIDALHDAGAVAWVTVTTPQEARLAAKAGADALVVQGAEAGGHRGSFDDGRPGEIGLLALLQLVHPVTDVPMVATGGIATGRAVAAVLALGAAAAQLGTSFMLCPESATSPAHRAAIDSDTETGLTRAFTGRLARGIANRWMAEHGDAPSAYPDVHHLTAGIRTAARERGDPDGFHLWAGEAHALAEPIPAGELVRRLAAEARAVLHGSSQAKEGASGPRSPAA